MANNSSTSSTNVEVEWLKGNLAQDYSNISLSTVPENNSSGSHQLNQSNQHDHLHHQHYRITERSSISSSTLKRNTKMELSKGDLLKLLACFEGELQARDITIAALKSEKVKQAASLGRYRPSVMCNPYIALLRDNIADKPSESLDSPVYSDQDMRVAADHQSQALHQLVMQSRWAHQHMISILKDAESKHKKVIQELEEEKCKHEHDTAQGDDITYGLEMERTRLRQELETERNTRKKLEKEVKKLVELADEERARQKQIVLVLLADRKRSIIKYIEEQKRSKDLGQILSEEKAKIDTMAEGLEEESKKSLQMEAELEKQAYDFEQERKNFHSQLLAKDQKISEIETELSHLKAEYDSLLKNKLQHLDNTTSSGAASGTAMISSVAKVVQPTAIVSSVPVSGPTTGIAQSVSSGQVTSVTSGRVMIVPPQPQVAHHLSSTNKIGGKPLGGNADSSVSLTIKAIPKTACIHPHLQQQQSGHPIPPKKGTSTVSSNATGRGVPPPVPPNKPVIPNKTVPRRVESTSSNSVGNTPDQEKKKLKDIPVIQQQQQQQQSSGKPNVNAQAQSQPGIGLFGQELADFQQMLVTMATSSSNNT